MQCSFLADSSRSRWLAVLFAVLLMGCSTADGDGEDSGSSSGGTDGAALDVPLSFDVSRTTVDQLACPGGHGCACGTDTDCVFGLCAPASAGLACTRPCADGCAAGFACAELQKDGNTIHHCVAAHVELCNPCTETDSCTSLGRADSACVDYGAAGRFCGSTCAGDADCPAGYACEVATAVEGHAARQCVIKPEAGGAVGEYGVCKCSPKAIAGTLGTACYVDGGAARCFGTRGCSAAGLSDCNAPPPGVEACDAVDNDCDGQTDEGTCDDANPCTTDACQAGKCVNTNTTAPCNADSSACTANDACKDGKCAAGIALSCDDGNACTKDSCDAQKGCNSEPQADLACEADGSACTTSDTCKQGACTAGTPVDCDDAKPCTTDGCDPATGKCSNTLVVGLGCDDGDVCTHTDLCSAGGACGGTARACNDGNACTTDTCDKTKILADSCVHTLASGGACEDGSKCTTTDVCASGVCTAGAAKVCKPSAACKDAYCDGLTGACVEVSAKVGAACEDGDQCTAPDVCDAVGACQKGGPRVCSDGDDCTVDGCAKETGCTTAPAADGTACDDGDACTDAGKCGTGKCEPGTAKKCDDNDACTTDSCDKTTGCKFAPVGDGTSCDDGDKCTENTACKSGKCAGTAKTCTDSGDPCKPNACDPADGNCKADNAKDGTVCNDNDKCTATDVCTVGTCAGAPLQATVSTFAGKGGTTGTDIDGLNAVTVITQPMFATVTTAGDVYVSQGDHPAGSTYRIRKISGGTTTTFVGATAGNADGKGSNAQFRRPRGLVFDDGGNLWVADMSNQLIRQVSADGTVTLRAGTKGDPDLGQDHVTGGFADGKGALAKFNLPVGIGFVKATPSYLVIADQLNHRVRKMTLDDYTVSTVAGDGTAKTTDGSGTGAQLNMPTGVAVFGGNIYVSELASHVIRRIDGTGAVTTIAGVTDAAGWKDASGNTAEFNAPLGIAVDIAGNLLIADSKNFVVRQLVLSTGAVTTIAGIATQADHKDGDALKAQFKSPAGIATDGAGNAYVVDFGEWRVRKLAEPYKVCKLP